MSVARSPADAARSRRRARIRQAVQIVIGVGGAVVLLVWGLPHFAQTTWPEVWHVIVDRVPLSKALGYQAIMLVGLYCYTFTITGAMPGITHPKALIVNVAGSSVGNLLPGGGAVGLAATYYMCRTWGFDAKRVSTMAIVTGVWNVLSRITLPVLAIIALYVGNTGLPQALADAAVAASITGIAIIVAFVSVLWSERAARTIGRVLDRVFGSLMQRFPRTRTASIEAVTMDLRARTSDLIRAHWLSLTLGLVGYFGVYYVLFVLIAREVGVDLPLGMLFAAYAIGRLLTAVGITPGGIGVTETATATALVGWGADPAAATALVLLFTVFTHLMEIPLGGLGWLAWSVLPKHPVTPGSPAPAAGR
ncbi:lysylphosphatidylglycerol synthase transmembrane domain-containing protein, partial [Nostocoides japonicum]|uniref:lysylphosphatidylglycerol synthase transmembrane domain-containing protein n=1 Tax=Nostocoides japonicum TaxID=99481 RepID=UPI0009FACB53